MKTSESDPDDGLSSPRKPSDFSLVVGGPFYRLLHWAHLSSDTLMLLRRRVIVLSLVAWLPLLALSILEGHALTGSIAVPFLMDLEVHIRFLLVLPLLLIAELVVHQRMHRVVEQFLERKLIPENAMAALESAIASAYRLRNSVLAEILLIMLVYGVGVLIVWRNYLAIDAATWYVVPSADGSKLSLAGMWFVFVSLPMVQFLLCRWYFRLFIWARFIWQVSRIKLSLIATHPDRVGGLGFLAMTVSALTVLAFAHGALLAGNLANQIFFLGSKLTEFKEEIVIMVIFVQCLVIGPLLMFTPQILALKWKGTIEYGALYARFVRELDTRWLRGGAPVNDTQTGINEVQTLADLDGGYQVVQSMRITPFSWRSILLLAVATLGPVAPLMLTLMPMEELLNKFFKILI